MRSYVPGHELVVARELSSALGYLQNGYQVMAGGTDLMVLFNAGRLIPTPLVSIRKIGQLNQFQVSSGFVDIGAAVPYSQIREHEVIAREFPLLAQAASWTGSVANQNRGTLGGNIANASPAADSAPVLLVYEAALKLVSQAGERWLAYCDFHLGYKQTALRPGELIAEIRLPRAGAKRVEYGRKVGARLAMAIAKVSFAAVTNESGVRIAIGSVAPIPLRCRQTETLLAGQVMRPALIEEAKAVIRREISPIDDIRSTGTYRAAVTENLLGEFLEKLL